MRADDIVILLLVAVCVGIVVFMAIHSRRQQPSGAALPQTDTDETADTRGVSAPPEAAPGMNRRRRRA